MSNCIHNPAIVCANCPPKQAGQHRGGFKQRTSEYIGRHSTMRATREAALTQLVTR